MYEVSLDGLDATITVKQPTGERAMRIMDAWSENVEDDGGVPFRSMYEILSKHLGDVVLSVHNVSLDGNPLDVLALDADEHGGIRNAETIFPLSGRIVLAVLAQLTLTGDTAKN